MKVICKYELQANPDFDWSAVTDNYEPGDPIGYGRTEEAAKADLMTMIDELRPDPLEGIDVYGGKGQWGEFSRA